MILTIPTVGTGGLASRASNFALDCCTNLLYDFVPTEGTEAQYAWQFWPGPLRVTNFKQANLANRETLTDWRIIESIAERLRLGPLDLGVA